MTAPDYTAEPDAIEQQARDWLNSYSYPDHLNPSMVATLAAWGRGLVREAEAREREACAKMAETPSGNYQVGLKAVPYWDGEKLAAAIRARGSAAK